MNILKEFFGNMPIFQKQVEKELEAKGLKPTDGVKKLESSRQGLRKIIGVIVTLVLIIGAIILFLNLKNGGTNDNHVAVSQSKESSHQQQSQKEQPKENDYLLKSSAKERASDATKAFKSWYQSFNNRQTVLEINQELLKNGANPMKLQESLIANLKQRFGNQVSDDFYTSLTNTFMVDPVVVDSDKGLTISKQADDESQWLSTWLFDTEKAAANTKIVLRNDFPYEWVDWRNKGRYAEKLKNIFKQVDWDNDLNYEVIGIDFTDINKNIEKNKILFVLVKYNEKLGKWQLTGNVGGVM